jgi:hypothetical protein
LDRHCKVVSGILLNRDQCCGCHGERNDQRTAPLPAAPRREHADERTYAINDALRVVGFRGSETQAVQFPQQALQFRCRGRPLLLSQCANGIARRAGTGDMHDSFTRDMLEIAQQRRRTSLRAQLVEPLDELARMVAGAGRQVAPPTYLERSDQQQQRHDLHHGERGGPHPLQRDRAAQHTQRSERSVRGGSNDCGSDINVHRITAQHDVCAQLRVEHGVLDRRDDERS